MRLLLPLLATALMTAACATAPPETTDSSGGGADETDTLIIVDGSFEDLRNLDLSPVVVDPEGDVHPDHPDRDVTAVYFARDDSNYYFYAAYADAGRDEAYVPRLWLDANGNGQNDKQGYQIEVLGPEVRIQPLVGDFEDYFDVQAHVASQPNSVEFSVGIDGLNVGDQVGFSGAITYFTSSVFEFVDRFEEQQLPSVEHAEAIVQIDGDISAVYFTQDSSRTYFFVEFVEGPPTQPAISRIWLDLDRDGSISGSDLQIDIVEGEVRVQSMRGPAEGYLDVQATAAAAGSTIELAMRTSDIGISHPFLVSAAVLTVTDAEIVWIDTSDRSIGDRDTARDEASGQQGSVNSFRVRGESHDQNRTDLLIDLLSFPDYVWEGYNSLLFRFVSEVHGTQDWDIRVPPGRAISTWVRDILPYGPTERFDLQIVFDKNENQQADPGESAVILPQLRRNQLNEGVSFSVDTPDSSSSRESNRNSALADQAFRASIVSTSSLNGSTGRLVYFTPSGRADVLALTTDFRVTTDDGGRMYGGSTYVFAVEKLLGADGRFLMNLNRFVRNQDGLMPIYSNRELANPFVSGANRIMIEGLEFDLSDFKSPTDPGRLRFFLTSYRDLGGRSIHTSDVERLMAISVTVFSEELGIEFVTGYRRFHHDAQWADPDVSRYKISFVQQESVTEQVAPLGPPGPRLFNPTRSPLTSRSALPFPLTVPPAPR